VNTPIFTSINAPSAFQSGGGVFDFGSVAERLIAPSLPLVRTLGIQPLTTSRESNLPPTIKTSGTGRCA